MCVGLRIQLNQIVTGVVFDQLVLTAELCADDGAAAGGVVRQRNRFAVRSVPLGCAVTAHRVDRLVVIVLGLRMHQDEGQFGDQIAVQILYYFN